jgi:hypothetical protein
MSKAITATKFIKLAQLFGSPEVAASILRTECWPDFSKVPAVAEDMADALEPCDKNAVAHATLYTIAQWARERVK